MLKKMLLALPVLAALAAGSAYAQAPRPLALDNTGSNQQLATQVAHQLSASGRMNHYQLDVVAQDGTIELSGLVGDAGQIAEATKLAQQVSGVKNVVNKLTAPGMVAQANMQEPIPAPAPKGPPPPPWAANEPIPSFSGGMGGPGFQPPAPPLPPYAWPTYAPYNNFSRVGYPNVYPADAMPFIGPINPFPRAPLGWRNAMLSFDDGFWYLSSHAGNRDWWSLRYW
jgi:hypothetical protein